MSKAERFATVQTDGVVTHVLVPVEAFERLTGTNVEALTPPTAEQVNAAVAVWNSPKTAWHDAEQTFREIVRRGIEHVRRETMLSQGELGKRIGLSQPQVSRLESNPENATLGMLRKIAEALSKPASAAARSKPSKRRPRAA